MSNDSPKVNEIDTSHITQHPPDTDIDQYHEVDHFRIERMARDQLWIAAYKDRDENSDEPEHHYDIWVDEDSGMHITYREETLVDDERS